MRAEAEALVGISPFAYGEGRRDMSTAPRLDFRLDGLVSIEPRLPALPWDFGEWLNFTWGFLSCLAGLCDLELVDDGSIGTA